MSLERCDMGIVEFGKERTGIYTTCVSESMSLIIEFRLRDSHLPLVDTVATTSQTIVEIDKMLAPDPDHPVVICWVEAASFETFEAELAKDATVATHSILETAPEQRFYLVRLQKPRLFPLKTAFVELGVVPDGRTMITDKGWKIRAHVPNRDALASFRETCREYGVSTDTTSSTSLGCWDDRWMPDIPCFECSRPVIDTPELQVIVTHRSALLAVYRGDTFSGHPQRGDRKTL